MSEIPFVFRVMPDEFFTDDFIEDVPMMKLIRYILKRIRSFSHEENLHNNRQYKKVTLEAFEWVYGRNTAAEECKSTPDIIRGRITQLLALGFIEKVPSRSTSTYTVYRLVTTAFKQNKPQQFTQQNPQQFTQQFTHKEEAKKKEPTNQPSIKKSKVTEKVVSLVGGGDLEIKEILEAANALEIPSSSFDETLLKALLREGIYLKAIKQTLTWYKKRMIAKDMVGIHNHKGLIRNEARKKHQINLDKEEKNDANRTA